MTLKQLGPNRTEVRTEKAIIFFSYQTPVAAIVDGKAYKTEYRWSRTTSKHISQWLDGIQAEEKPQEFFSFLAD